MRKRYGGSCGGLPGERFADYLQVLEICTTLTGQPERNETYGTQVAQRVETMINDAKAREDQPRILFVRAGSSAKYTKAKTAENHFVCEMLDNLVVLSGGRVYFAGSKEACWKAAF